jgi:ribonuclease BN (tRNA processing enzyme)
MKLTVLGCSDAFGSGGRLQTSFHVAHSGGEFLIDCGATTMVGLQRQGLDPNSISTIFITHLHGDHFGGLIWWLVHAIHVAQRTATLTITGPIGIEKRFNAAAEALFPGSTTTRRGFSINFREYTEREPMSVNGVSVTPFEVSHPSGAPPYALRITVDGKTITFSGDTEWTESLVAASDGADIFITDCFGYHRPTRYHMNWRIIEANLPRLTANRILLSHMGPDMLANCANVSDPRVMLAEDGLIIDL